MENVSTALIIVASILIAVLIASLIVYVFSVVSAFAQKQVNAENVSEVLQFNQPFLELEAKASHDFSGRSRQIEVGATAVANWLSGSLVGSATPVGVGE